MSKLEELIAELCPDGVQFKTLGDICDVCGRIGFRGYTRQDQVEKGCGAISLSPSNIVSEQIAYDNCTYISWLKYNESPEIMAEENDIIFCKTASVGKTAIIKRLPQEATINPQLVLLKHIKCIPDYLAYCLKTDEFQKKVYRIKGLGTIPTISQKDFNILTIPIPPLPVQSEIVRILDIFTELTVELTAELTVRKKQYEYYRKLLFTNKEYKYLTLGEVANTFRGQFITKKNTKPGDIPVILGGQEPAYYINQSNHNGEIVVVARSGASAGFVSYWNEPIFVTDGFGYEAKDRVIISKYLYYALKNIEKELNNMKRGAGVPHVSGEALLQVKIPVPSLERQKEIIDIADKFDTLCNNISTGLPAEIEARKKQYEYYRDKLLTFKELS